MTQHWGYRSVLKSRQVISCTNIHRQSLPRKCGDRELKPENIAYNNLYSLIHVYQTLTGYEEFVKAVISVMILYSIMQKVGLKQIILSVT